MLLVELPRCGSESTFRGCIWQFYQKAASYTALSDVQVRHGCRKVGTRLPERTPSRKASAQPEERVHFGLCQVSTKLAVLPDCIHLLRRSARVSPCLNLADLPRTAWPQGWPRRGIFRRGRGSGPGSKPQPPLPFAVLGPIRLFDTQPRWGRLDALRAALADSGKRPERTRVIADPVRHFGRLSRGGWSSAPKRQEPTPCPGRMPPPTPPASPPR